MQRAMTTAPPRWIRPAAAAALGAAILLASPACSSSPLPPPPKAVVAYDEGDYQRAYDDAVAEHSRTSGLRRDRAALMAGLSAHALGRQAQAARWLRPLTDHPDRDISGRACATLGLIEADHANHEAAAALLSTAGRKLSGDAAARANFQAAESYAALGRSSAARLHYRLAAASTDDQRIKDLGDDRLSLDAYTVQVGAYGSLANARSRADSTRPRAVALGLGEPRIVERPGSAGQSLYLVHVGAYESKSEAATAKLRLGSDAVVTRARR